jgi:hypothetical protein
LAAFFIRVAQSLFNIYKNSPTPLGAQGIAAESPQDLHGQIRGLGAESPVFLRFAKKRAKIPD